MTPDHIHVWKPGGCKRTLILLHGTGGNENDLLQLGAAIDPAASLLGIRGRSLDEGFPRFFRRRAEGIFDFDDVREKASELADFVRSASGNYGFDLTSSVVMGYSNGANAAAAGLLLRPDTFQHAILLRAMMPLDNAPSTDLSGHRVQIQSGKVDRMAPAASVKRLEGALTSCGAKVSHEIVAGGHELSRADVESAKQWLSELPV